MLSKKPTVSYRIWSDWANMLKEMNHEQLIATVTLALEEIVPEGIKFIKEEMDEPPGFGPRELDNIMSSMADYYNCPLGHE